jgi:hypothetical protein
VIGSWLVDAGVLDLVDVVSVRQCPQDGELAEDVLVGTGAALLTLRGTPKGASRGPIAPQRRRGSVEVAPLVPLRTRQSVYPSRIGEGALNALFRCSPCHLALPGGVGRKWRGPRRAAGPSGHARWRVAAYLWLRPEDASVTRSSKKP